MNINRVNASKLINVNSLTKKEDIFKIKKELGLDPLGTLSLVKSLSSYNVCDNNFIGSDNKIKDIKREVANGTYKRDCIHVAQKILDYIKESRSV
jgi:anti-sigma28 factor (negative regulator of flagellin synthesis)